MYSEKTIWITGASSGIGEALAVAFAREGAQLVLSARRGKELERVQKRCEQEGTGKVEHLVLPLDVTDHDAAGPAAERVKSRFGHIDALINNAGISQRSLCIDTEMAVYRRIMEVDVLGQINLTQAVLPMMLEQGSGQIAITSSVAGKVGVPYRTGYCAAKFAVIGFNDALRAEVANQGISVHTIVPGYVQTNISMHALKGDNSEFGKVDKVIAGGMDVDRCAAVILKGLKKGKPEIPVGEGFEMHALWIKRFFPGIVFKKAAEMV